MLSLILDIAIAAATSCPHHDAMKDAHEHVVDPPLMIVLHAPDALSAGRPVELQLEILRPVPDAVPLVIDVKVPAGVQLVQGLPTRPIVDTTSTRIVLPLRLAVDQLPEEDLVVTVRSRAPSHGALATTVYRFGRVAPTPRAPVQGPELRVRGRSPVARPIMLRRYERD